MLLLFDVAQDAIPEHDEWHTHEHLPERLSIPGFVRGTREIGFPHLRLIEGRGEGEDGDDAGRQFRRFEGRRLALFGSVFER